MADTLSIDGRNVDVTQLSPIARATLLRLEQVDAGLALRRRQRAALTMAWNVHVEALQAEVLHATTGIDIASLLYD
ncbi:hypothetical protein [Rhodobaculum claviforme]|uniref:Uncharacterized protein n=1 Tax=Rhodobaculum claviforme TaxID=1549854 RepID=A0A934TKR0_9RHOB|nr:hypothetical protein [Rhodobaculum claviforme]MBK5927236.1 hypothetical protein [Rhodobaculum claviforme]